MVSYSFTDKHAGNDVIRRFFPVMIKHANDERKYVMKGINWALRQTGKRNKDLHIEAVDTANTIFSLSSRPAHWIATNSLRQLQSHGIYFKNYPADLYGT